ncbi:unnamed protein product [Nippostrongylus brasiliensis]|uniref:Secreted protein n=1 Tax=Nippostrongylus brasiliensis TaxID=27835 RepID=A0A0N4XGX9_NIPBR|nr:unnamed protein product [Nippostrongylus brasiliensis]
MIFSRIIILVTVLIISDAIADECASGKVKLCEIIRDAHTSNQDGLKLMDGESAKAALDSADGLVVAVLEAEGSELIAALKKALEAELGAYVQVKAECPTLGGKCKEVLFEVGYALLGLIMAIADEHPDVKTMTNVEDTLETVYPHMFDADPSQYRDKLYDAGKKILEII